MITGLFMSWTDSISKAWYPIQNRKMLMAIGLGV